MIPKIIHYCWFGGKEKTELAEKCIRSWKRHCKDYQVIEWNEDNFSVAEAPLYVRQAYEAKKWAFVTDYVRLYALVTHGGIYMDTDVEVIKPLDCYLNNRAFAGFENEREIQTGIMACEKDFPLFQEFLEYYNFAEFIKSDGTLNTKTNVVVFTDLLRSKGLIENNTYQEIEGISLFPKDFFCPIDYDSMKCRKTKNTVTIHWFNGSWQDNVVKNKRMEYLKKQRNREIRVKLGKVLKIPLFLLKKILGIKHYENVKDTLLKMIKFK